MKGFDCFLRRSACLALALVFAAPVLALEPPEAGELEKYHRDGTLESRQRFARELGNHMVSPRLAANMKCALEGGTVAAPPDGWRGMPTKGNVKILALLIGFSDYLPNTEAELVERRLFGDGTSSAPNDSLRNFYRRASYDQLEIGGSALGWYITSYPRASVSESTSGREKLIKEALMYFEDTGHDFTQYDNDGDGRIDYLVVVWTGPDTGWANFWWGYQTYFQDGSFTLDGKKLGSYSWQWEARPASGTFSPRVVIHETGHALGLPDYYDYDDWVGPRGGVGGLDQMDGNWGDHNCFSKMLLEWLTPTVVDSTTSSVSLTPSGTNPDAVMLMPEASAQNQFSEYFMVQYRNISGNDSTYPNEGLLVWHLDARTDASEYDFLYDNSYSDHKLLRLMEADGLEEIEQNDWADGDDYYTEGASFGPGTMPSNHRYCGIPGGIEIANISEAGDAITFDAAVAASKPVLSGVQKLKNPFRLKITGSNIQSGASVLIGGDSEVWTKVSYQDGAIVLAKGDKLKRKFGKRIPTPILVINPDGSAARITYTR